MSETESSTAGQLQNTTSVDEDLLLFKRKEKSDGEASLVERDRKGRKLRVVAGRHFSNEAARIFTQDISPQITDPSSWLFLIEGQVTLDPAVEVKTATEIALASSIPTFDPIVNIYGSEVLETYNRIHTTPPVPLDIYRGTLTRSLMEHRGTTKPETIAALMGFPTVEDATAAIKSSEQEQAKDPESHLKTVVAMQSEMLEITNIRCAQVLDYYLDKNPERTNVAMYMGKAHLPILDIAQESIPQDLQLSQEGVEQVINREGRANLDRMIRLLEAQMVL